MATRTEELRKLMKDYNLNSPQVGQMLNRAAQTVRIWRCKGDKREIPEHTLEALRAKLAKSK